MMQKTEGFNWIRNLRTRWISVRLLRIIAISLAISIVIGTIAIKFFQVELWLVTLLFLAALILLLFFKQFWKTSYADVSRFVNNKYPEVEESADLLLQNPEELSFLQQFQRNKIEAIIPSLTQPKELYAKIYSSVAILAIGLILSYGITKIPRINSRLIQSPDTETTVPVVKENILPEISDFTLIITPPAYTRKGTRTQSVFTIKAENGAKANWQIETNIAIKQLQFVFNDKEYINLKPTDGKNKSWAFSKAINKSGFYQVVIDGKKSDLYQIEIIADLPVSIKISQPKQHTTIDIGQPQKFTLKANLTDDYGISDAFISATMASGKGEGVSFTEKKLSFETNFGNQKNVSLTKNIDLKSLGMKPGDELYFFIKAMDNHGQSSRSDVYFVSIVDTTELMSLSGMTNGVNLVPEYFRSQRQIIIDTEKLLKEQASIPAETFKTRANNLGIDQKLLRLRYGQFLGEENETEIGGDHDDHDEHEEHKGGEEKFGDVTAIMDKYAHKHDIAEDATFFEPEMKAQLKAVLTEMWNSELRLRTYKPQEALPYEYKALRLLKDLQQKSRAYVAKTTVKTASLKPEKRLSGELDKILQPVQKMSFEQKELRTIHLKTSLSILEGRRNGKKFTANEKLMLNETEKYMIGAAADNPASFLSALTSLRRVSSASKPNSKDIDAVQSGIQKMIKFEPLKPQHKTTLPASALYQNYFNNLNKSGR
ncbi:hypothetical protein QWY86_19965 [Pedobacter aquatilis]|uniref:DUF4175 family protein n=1 Tax=Pedobacter aquatilis TaxID=351343 RepID=UPI0025B44289|nr:DUF4175 family protein [Pedobacter aquatilis]MDN3588963.1 hypothetical protein [Pedobacter aquatilis]